MKKLTAFLMAITLAAAFTGCGKDEQSSSQSSQESSSSIAETETKEEAATEAETEAATLEETTEAAEESAPAADSEGALGLLNTVWASYEDSEKFSAAGGDYSEENMTMDAPGKFGIEDKETLDSVLGIPASAAELTDDAASLVHMMNANTFTCGAFHAANEGDVQTIADQIKENILVRQWMCGFPDKIIVMTVDSYVISAFGSAELIDTFQAKVTAAFDSAQLVYDEALA